LRCRPGRAGLRVEREHHVADVAALVRELDVAVHDLLQDLVIREPLFLKLGGVVVAEDAGRRRLECAGADRGGHEHALAPDDGRRPAATGEIDRPGDVVRRRPALGQRRLVGDAGAAGPAKLRPLVRACGLNHAVRPEAREAGDEEQGEVTHGATRYHPRWRSAMDG
jgi:hypothetical protein